MTIPQGFVPPHELTNLPPSTPVLIGLSGGADSCLLFHLMVACGKQYGTPVYAAHFHHGIRGEEADRDLAFCEKLCKDARVPLFVQKEDIPALATQNGRSLELQARLSRYAFFEHIMAQHHIPLLLTAHHANDQLETLLLRFLRGSGTKGMGGIHPVRPFFEGSLVVRPLLNCTKDDILASCKAMNLSYVTDSTNIQDDATRNRLRHHLIPLLEDMSDYGSPTTAALRLAQNAREDEDFISAWVEVAKTDCITDNGIRLSKLKALHPAIGKRLLCDVFVTALSAHSPTGDGRHSLSARHLDSLWDFCLTAHSGQELHLPGPMRGVLQGDMLSFLPPKHAPHIQENTPRPLPMGLTLWDDGKLGIWIYSSSEAPLVSGKILASAHFPLNVLPLSVRSRQEGDIICNHGMHKKLKKLLCDKKIPSELRDQLPLICYGEENTPLWYPTVAFADGFQAPQDPKEGIHILIFYPQG